MDPTNVEVRVIAAGGKFLGDDVGDATVWIRDADTGELLASGGVQGGSGNVQEIMGTARPWSRPIPVDGASVFAAALPLAAPRRVEISARGPGGSLGSQRTVSVQEWLVPGYDRVGTEGVLLVIPGQLVQILTPGTHMQLASVPARVGVTANVAMMCGCPIQAPPAQPGQPAPYWPDTAFQVDVRLTRLGAQRTLVSQSAMTFTATSRYNAAVRIDDAGFYEIAVVARETGTGNFGYDRVTVFFPPPSA